MPRLRNVLILHILNGMIRPRFAPYLQLMRPEQWVKNLVIFLPLFFGLKLLNVSALVECLYAFIAFSSAASAIYIFNDYRDISDDRVHPQKRFRPLAARTAESRTALALALGLAGLAALISVSLKVEISNIIAAYVVVNIFYSLLLKHFAILDICIVALGFVARLFVGAISANVPLSMWIILVIFLSALFAALAKRRDDLLIFLSSNVKARESLDGYNLPFVNAAIGITASAVLMSYILYTVSPEQLAKVHGHYLYLTSFFTILGLLRYLQVIFVQEKSGSPTDIFLHDRFIQLCLCLWLISFGCILYL